MEQMYSLKTAAQLLDLSTGEVRSLGQKAGISFYVIGDSTRVSETGLSTLVNYATRSEHHVEQMFSLDSAAELLDVSTKTLRRLIREKDIPTYRVGKNLRITQRDLSMLVERQKSMADY
ncbi:MAG: helix-turn-helix domain-containing protein [Candidatus Marinimicrobia bacterium]|jgi:excisionase family DNA binding protein|nr:helix-turn-helix domain-containing protein [Candidatus Neomarinimicrobiota bacterium]MBT4714710.1 helix-turn-helix domain-containing protein [Candidatus Neomarinimicrobiota bacterium]